MENSSVPPLGVFLIGLLLFASALLSILAALHSWGR